MQDTKIIEHGVFYLASEYFGVPIADLSRRTRIAGLERDLHDGVRFSFEVEKRFGVEFDEGESEHLNTVGDYVRHLAVHLETPPVMHEEAHGHEHRKAA